jgi:glycosyltransferase involved in cell wall biosynthesis
MCAKPLKNRQQTLKPRRNAMPRIGIVVPCFNEEDALPKTSERLLSLLSQMIKEEAVSPESSICFVDDGSKDRTWGLIEARARANRHVKGIKLTRNRGHQNALLAGLFTLEGDAVITIDADLQDDPATIHEMLAEHRAGAEIVYGVRRKRETDSWFKRLTAESFYAWMRGMGVEVLTNHADFRLLSRRAIEALKSFHEVNLFLRGIVPLLGFRSSVVYYERRERQAGRSKYPLKKMLAFALEGITSFSVVPLRFITFLGIMTFLASILVGLWTLWVKFFTDRAVPGWTSIVLPLSLLGGVQILCIGIIGEYLGKIYSETKRRPRYIIEKQV